MSKLTYTQGELLADRPYASRLRHGDVLFHGGLDAEGRYIPPRSAYRLEAIRSWTERLTADGHPTRVIDPKDLDLIFFPNAAQAKLLLRHGLRGAMTRILTLIGITEGFGNDGLRATPRPALQPLFAESLEGTCLAHLDRGLLEAHGRDEAGTESEAGHDGMWYAIRDAALDHPTITPDMFENLPIAPPPGYRGPAKASPDALGAGQMILQFTNLEPLLEVQLLILTQLLIIELVAFGTFAWAQDVLGDPTCSAAPEFAPRMVEYIKEDEAIHVGYLQCALAEIRCRTLIGTDGQRIPGREVIDALCARSWERNRDPVRRQRLFVHRMRQIRDELAAHADGDRLLAEFVALGPVPTIN